MLPEEQAVFIDMCCKYDIKEFLVCTLMYFRSCDEIINFLLKVSYNNEYIASRNVKIENSILKGKKQGPCEKKILN